MIAAEMLCRPIIQHCLSGLDLHFSLTTVHCPITLMELRSPINVGWVPAEIKPGTPTYNHIVPLVVKDEVFPGVPVSRCGFEFLSACLLDDHDVKARMIECSYCHQNFHAVCMDKLRFGHMKDCGCLLMHRSDLVPTVDKWVYYTNLKQWDNHYMAKK